MKTDVSAANNVVNGNILPRRLSSCKLGSMKTPLHPYHHGNLREALLERAERALETGGVANVTLRELSRELGVSHASPRRHFADKQALLDALAVRGFERLGVVTTRAAKARAEDFSARLTRLARAYVSFALRHPSLFALMFEAKHRADAPPELLAASEQTFAPPLAVFAQGQAAGEIVAGDPANLSLGAMAAVHGLLSISTDGRFKGIPLDRLVGEMIERIVWGLRPRA